MRDERAMRRRGVGVLATVAIVAAAVLVVGAETPNAVVDAAAETLPDATTDGVLAYACVTAAGTYDICVTNPATGEAVNVTNTAGINETDPTWSPDGRTLMAVSWTPGGNNIRPQAPGDGTLVKIDVTDPTDPGPILSTGIKGFAPDWGPRGDLVFSRFNSPPPFHNRAPIDVVFTRYSEALERFDSKRTVLSPGGNMWSDASWSPDGTFVVTSFRKGQALDSSAPAWGELYRLPPAAWPAPGSLNLVVGNVSGPSVSAARQSGNGYLEGDVNPDGNLIAHVQCTVMQLTGDCSSASRRLAVMSVDGLEEPGLATLTDAGENARNPAWSPTGGDIAYGSSAGIRIYDTTTGDRYAVAGSKPGDMQPSWRPQPDERSGAFTAADDGFFKRAFREGDNVNVVVTDVPAEATAVRTCVFEASAIAAPLQPDLGCVDQIAPAPLRNIAGAADPAGVGLSFGQLAPGRYQALVEFDGSPKRLTTNIFTVTCFGGTCEVFPRFAIAASLDAFADRLETLTLILEASCLWMEYTQRVLTTARTFSNAIQSGNLTRLITTLALNEMLSVAASTSLAVTFKYYSDQFTDSRPGKAATEVYKGAKTYNDKVAEREQLQFEYAQSIDPGDREITKQKISDKDREIKSGVTKSAGKIALEVAKDAAFDQYPKVKEAYETVEDLSKNPVCGVFVNQNTRMVNAARALADGLRNPTSPSMLQSLMLSAEGPMDSGVAAQALELPAPTTLGTDPLPGSFIPEDADTDRAFRALVAAVPAIAQLLDGTERFADNLDGVDEIGTLTGHLDDFRSWAGMLPALGNEVKRSSLIEGVPADEPLADASDIADLEETQQFIRDNPLSEAERQALIAAGSSSEDIDALLARAENLDIGILTTITASQLVDALNPLADEIAALTEDLSTDMRILRAALSLAPIAEDGFAITEIDTPVTITPPVFDAQGDFVDVEVATPPNHGEVTASLDTFVYIPEPGFTGQDTFTYRATDRTNTSDVRTITVDVKLPAPSPAPDAYGLRQGETLIVPAPGVLTNDSTPRLGLTAELVTQPAQGFVELGADGSLSITAPPDRSGTYTFTYRASYPGSAPSDPVTVTIDVVAVQAPPVASPDSVTTPEDTPVDVAPLANDGDPDGDPLTLVGVTRPAHGTVRCAGSICTYTPRPNYNGTDEFRYTVSDGTGRRSLGIVSVTVTAVDDAPVAATDLLSFDAGVPGVVDVLANDTHPDGLDLQFVSAGGTTNGSLSCTVSGVCTYTPNDATVVSDQATYTIRDERGTEAQGTITIRRFATFEEIASAGPLLYIVTGSSLACAVDYDADVFGAFFADFGCGTFLATGGTLYGPERISGSANPPQPRTTFTRSTQTGVTGTGVVDDPFSVTTTVGVGDTGLRLAQRDRYVTGEESYLTDLTITNTSDSARTLTLYRAGDCVVADDDEGFAALDPLTGAATCTAATGDRIIRWFPLSPGSSAYAGDSDAMWAAIAGQQPFADECLCAEPAPFDNGAGLSWSVELAPGETITRSHRTMFAPFEYDPITIEAVADAAASSVNAANGYTVTVTNPNSTTPVAISELAVELPADFVYSTGSTSGDLTTDPSTADGTLRWAAPFTVPAGGSRTFRIDVTTGPTAGTFLTAASGTAASIPITPSGLHAPITLTDNLDPAPRPAVTTTLLTANFDGTASFDPDGTVVEHRWSFGDGSTGVGATTTHTYATPGTYDAELTVIDNVGASATRAIRVTVVDPNQPPTAAITATADGAGVPASGLTGPPGADALVAASLTDPIPTKVPIRFDGTDSVDLDGAIVDWTWDFGDGTSGGGPVVEKAYDTAGSYRIVLTVTDDRGATDSASTDIEVADPVNLDPTAAFTALVDGLAVAFDGGGSSDVDGPDGRPVAWAWDFGDGTTGSGPEAAHTYAIEGIFDVTLTVVDDRGAVDTIVRPVGVGQFANVAPSAAVTRSGSELTVDLDGSDSDDRDGEVVAYEWDFGDETFASGPTARHTFAAPGTYLVTLLVTDDDGALDLVALALEVPVQVDPTTTAPPTTAPPTTAVAPTPVAPLPPIATTTPFSDLAPTAVTAPTTQPPLSAELPSTGSDLGSTFRLVLLLLSGGLLLVFVARLPRPRERRTE